MHVDLMLLVQDVFESMQDSSFVHIEDNVVIPGSPQV